MIAAKKANSMIQSWNDRLFRYLHHPPLLVGLAFMLYGLHTLFFVNWIVDDAGISFVYARNLADHFALVSQPGRVPVEGYSNFLWVVIMAGFFKTGIFHPYIVPKIIGMLMVLLTLIVLDRGLFRFVKLPTAPRALILFLLVINSPFVMWSVGGLENPLYVLLTVLLWYEISEWMTHPREINWKDAAKFGILCSAIALTRPDGLLYAGIFPAILLFTGLLRTKPGYFLVYIGCLGVLLGTYQVFRWQYFHDMLPDPFYAKGGIDFAALWSGKKSYDLMRSIAGPFGLLIAGGTLILAGYLAWKRTLTWGEGLLLLFTATSIAAFLLLPYDWLDWYRYASPFFPFFYATMVVVGNSFFQQEALFIGWYNRWIYASLALFIAGSVGMGIILTEKRSKNPVIPFSQVAQQFGHNYNVYADRLQVQNGSLLVPDLGGTLYYSHLRVFDLAGLCDKTIAQTFQQDPTQFYHYIFEEVQPTFIHTHGFWSLEAAFDTDSRFRRDYVPLREYEDVFIKTQFGKSVMSGDYVRKSIADSAGAAFTLLVTELVQE